MPVFDGKQMNQFFLRLTLHAPWHLLVFLHHTLVLTFPGMDGFAKQWGGGIIKFYAQGIYDRYSVYSVVYGLLAYTKNGIPISL